MKRKITVLALCALLLALCFPAEAQQPVVKVPKIGFLANGSPLTQPLRCVSKLFARGFAKSVTPMGKTLILNTAMPGGHLSDYRSWLRN